MSDPTAEDQGGEVKPITAAHLQRGVKLRAGRRQVLVVGAVDSDDEPEDVEIDWHFQHDDGTPLTNERYTLHFAEGEPTRQGTLQGGHLRTKVPPHQHLAVDIEGYGHVESGSEELAPAASVGGAAAEGDAAAEGGAATEPAVRAPEDDHVDISWEFRRPDGAPLADEGYVLHFADGTTREGRLSGGKLEARVPDEHLAVDIPGFAHLEVDA